MSLSTGQQFPKDVLFNYVPIDISQLNAAEALACGNPLPLNLDKFFAKHSKVVFVAVPGAFTPTCTENHIPPFLLHLRDLKSKGVLAVVVLSANDPFVINAWGKLLLKEAKVTGLDIPDVVFASDPNSEFSKLIGASLDLTSRGFGVRTGRYAIVVDSGKVTYFGQEPGGDVGVSGYDAVFSKL